MLEVLASDSEELARVTTATDDLETLCVRLFEAGEGWDRRAEEMDRRRAAREAGYQEETAQFRDLATNFAQRVVGGSGGKRPAAPPNDPVITAAVAEAFRSAREEARRRAEEARNLRARGLELAGALDLTGATVALSELLEANAPLVKRFRELREAAGLVARDVNPVVLDATLDVWRPVFEALLGSRHGSDVDGRLLALGWLHRAGVELPDHIAEIDEGKKRIDLARGDAGGDRIDSAVIAWKAAAFDFLKGDHRG